MDPLSRSRKTSGTGNWYTSLVVFLAFLVPISPILAEIQDGAGTGVCAGTGSTNQLE